jgi:hypothetical protein
MTNVSRVVASGSSYQHRCWYNDLASIDGRYIGTASGIFLAVEMEESILGRELMPAPVSLRDALMVRPNRTLVCGLVLPDYVVVHDTNDEVVIGRDVDVETLLRLYRAGACRRLGPSELQPGQCSVLRGGSHALHAFYPRDNHLVAKIVYNEGTNRGTTTLHLSQRRSS